MIDRKLVQQFYDGIREAGYKSQESGNKKVFALLDAHPRLALIRFKDYLGDDPDTLGYPLDEPVFCGNLELAERLIALVSAGSPSTPRSRDQATEAYEKSPLRVIKRG